jgi:hypothetical protein
MVDAQVGPLGRRLFGDGEKIPGAMSTATIQDGTNPSEPNAFPHMSLLTGPSPPMRRIYAVLPALLCPGQGPRRSEVCSDRPAVGQHEKIVTLFEPACRSLIVIAVFSGLLYLRGAVSSAPAVAGCL